MMPGQSRIIRLRRVPAYSRQMSACASGTSARLAGSADGMQEKSVTVTSKWVKGLLSFNNDIEKIVVDDGGLTVTQYRILLELERLNGRGRVGDIAEALILQSSSITCAADRLVREGRIAREEDPGDRRGVLLVLTDAGERTLHVVGVLITEAISRMWADYTPEERALLFASARYCAEVLRVPYECAEGTNAETAFAQVSRTVLRIASQAVKNRSHLSVTEFRILLDLLEEGTGARVSDIAAALGLRANVVTSATDSLYEQGLIRRRRDSADRRAVILEMTPDGRVRALDALDAFSGAYRGLLQRAPSGFLKTLMKVGE